MEELQPDDYAVCLIGHGTRDPEGIDEFLNFSAKLKEREPERIIEHGFLEFAQPTIDEAVFNCVQRGAKNIVVLPGLLIMANHAKKDIPGKVLEMRRKYPSLNIQHGRPLDFHPKILKVCSERIKVAENNSTSETARADTLLMTVGRGSSDLDANSKIVKTSQMLSESMGFGGVDTSFIGASQPLFPEALKRSTQMGFKRIIIFPYLLFTGMLVKKIFSITNDIQKMHPEIELLKTQYLNYDELIIDVFRERAREVPLSLQHINYS